MNWYVDDPVDDDWVDMSIVMNELMRIDVLMNDEWMNELMMILLMILLLIDVAVVVNESICWWYCWLMSIDEDDVDDDRDEWVDDPVDDDWVVDRLMILLMRIDVLINDEWIDCW